MSKILIVAALLVVGACARASEEPAPADEATPADAVEQVAPPAEPADTMARDTAGT